MSWEKETEKDSEGLRNWGEANVFLVFLSTAEEAGDSFIMRKTTTGWFRRWEDPKSQVLDRDTFPCIWSLKSACALPEVYAVFLCVRFWCENSQSNKNCGKCFDRAAISSQAQGCNRQFPERLFISLCSKVQCIGLSLSSAAADCNWLNTPRLTLLYDGCLFAVVWLSLVCLFWAA